MAIMRSLHLTFVVFAALALAACGDSAPEYATVDSPKQNRVTTVRHDHLVRFAGNNANLDPQEAARLSQFLSNNRSEGNATVTIGPATSPALSAGRERVVRELLSARGYRPVDVVYASTAESLNQVTVSVASNVVITPRCPDFSKPTEYNYSNTTHSNYGCASAHNLGIMVADPADLVRGRDQGVQDGPNAVLGIQRYRTGKVTPLMKNGDGSAEAGSK
jgi:pilus assembly protein CpaD